MRPVVRIANICTWSIGDTDPRSPSKEGTHLLHLTRIFDALSTQSIGRTELDKLGRRVAEEELSIVGSELVSDFSTERRVRNDTRRLIEGILTNLLT